MTIVDRIKGDIEARIASGEWRPGFRIPFEHELVAQYGCARATVGSALTALGRAGMIERRRKAGSFVAHPQIHAAVLDIPDIGAAIAMRTGSYRFEGILPETASMMSQTAGFGAGIPLRAVSGIHHGGDGPFACESRLINLDAVPEARDADFAKHPPGTWLLDHVAWSEARHRISAVGADPDVARMLDVPHHTPCLLVERWTWRTGVPITYARQIFRGDRYDLTATFSPQGR
jgi:GntR family histidine utilization transcriptional repressor